LVKAAETEAEELAQRKENMEKIRQYQEAQKGMAKKKMDFLSSIETNIRVKGCHIF
jgi:hypothetical protein